MDSAATLESLKTSLSSYFTANYSGQVPNIIELYPLDLNRLDQRSDIPGIRIGISEIGDEPGAQASASKVLDTNQDYEFQLFFRTGRNGIQYDYAEKLMMDYKDLIYDWIYQLDPGGTTTNELISLYWAGSDQPIREPMFTAMNITATAHRNLV